MANSKATKKALFMSIMSLLLCFTMLMGATFAWFTDTVTSANNIIKSGNLDIELYYQVEGQNDWTKVTTDSNIFKENALWEPGYTEVVRLKAVNEGSLALKYQLGVNVASETGSTNVNGESFKLSDHIKFGLVDGNENYTRDTAIAAVDAKATPLATAFTSDVIKLYPAGYKEPGSAESFPQEQIVTLVVYMPTTVDNVANHAATADPPVINLGLNVNATQLDAEVDSFDNTYDKDAKINCDYWDGTTETVPEADEDGVYRISTAAELIGMMNDSYYPNNNAYQNVVLENNIDLGGQTISGFGDDSGFFDGVFDGQGYSISNFKIDATDRDYYAGLFNQVSQYSGENTVIKNLTVENAVIAGSSQVGAIVGGMNGSTIVENCKVINCELSAVKKVGSIVGYTAGGTVKNCYAENCTVLYSEKEGSEILGYENTGSTVSGNTFKNVVVAVGVTTVEELKSAITNAAEGDVIAIIDDIAVTEKWDNRYAGKTDKEVVIDGRGNTLKFMGEVADGGNYHAVFRFTNKATVKNLTFDLSEAVNVSYKWLRAISATSDLTVDNCTFIGSDNHTHDNAIVIGDTNESDQIDASVTITNCTFTNWRRGISDNENAKEVRKIVVDGNTFIIAPVYISAYENICFTNNTMNDSLVNITSYTASSTAKVEATGNTLDTAKINVIGSASKLFDATNVTAQDGIIVNGEA